MDGWEVLAALKQDVDTRHIPVHIVSADSPTAAGMRVGAIGHASKPLKQDDIDEVLEKLASASATADKLVLVVEDDAVIRRETVRIIGNGNVKTMEVETGGQAMEALRARRYDLVVLDLGLPDMPGLELLERVAAEKIHMPPVIVYTVRELTQDEELALRRYADSIILKDVRSQERLIDEVALFLHRVVSDLPEEKKKAIRHLHQSDEPLRGKKVLIVEDDIRTMFAMSRLLAGHGVSPLRAENGEKALSLLEGNPDVDLVLMDMMMPVMDGYTASRAIRGQQRFARLPIIALTAKAMKEDRQKCLDAGASDYLSKPVDQDRLISLMRVWLSR
jgi:CheY-like chemotaxis protein